MTPSVTERPRRILIVEDAPGCATTLEVALDHLAAGAIRFAGSAEEALHALESENIALLVTDVHLPRMSGLELLERVRADSRFRHLRVLVLSGDTDPATPSRALQLGADAFFAKPYSPAAVRRKVEELLNAK